MPTQNLRRLSHAAIILVYAISLALFFVGCARGASAAVPVAPASAASWWLEPATIWDVLKWLIAGLAAIVGWAIRIEITLSRHAGTLESQGQTLGKHDEIIASNAKLIEKHESLLEAHIKSLEHIDRTLAEWTIVKEERAARLMKIETRLERLDKIEGKLDVALQMRQDRYPQPLQERP